jgi:hypothetical protein
MNSSDDSGKPFPSLFLLFVLLRLDAMDLGQVLQGGSSFSSNHGQGFLLPWLAVVSLPVITVVFVLVVLVTMLLPGNPSERPVYND